MDTLRADHGGPSRSVTALCSHLAERASVGLIAYGPRPDEPEPILPADPHQVRLHFAEAEPGWRPLFRGSAYETVTATLLGEAELLHNHGLWAPCSHAAVRAARQLGVPIVASTRGMLTTWALHQKRWKKRVGWATYQGQDLRAARLLHATSEGEVEDIRRAGLRQPVVVLPNGVVIPEARPEKAGPTHEALFLSRLHPGKGALDLVQAWGRVRPEGWRLTIAGPDVDGHRAEVEQAVRDLGLQGSVQFTGAVGDDEKWGLYRRADLFVLPTASENFGLVIAEALAAGVPVITTKGAPWAVLEEKACGWWIDHGVAPLESALQEATGAPAERLRAMGQRGRAYAEAHLAWDHIAEEMAAAYRWVLGRGERPASVVTE